MRRANSNARCFMSLGVDIDSPFKAYSFSFYFAFLLFTFNFDQARQRIGHPRLRPAHVLDPIYVETLALIIEVAVGTLQIVDGPRRDRKSVV